MFCVKLVVRKTCGLYINEELFKVFTLYASKQKPLSACEVWENALIEYMTNHPVKLISVNVQQIMASAIPSLLEEVRMGTLGPQIEHLINRCKKSNGNIPEALRDILSKALIKGTEIKNPTEGFLMLLQEGVKYVKAS